MNGRLQITRQTGRNLHITAQTHADITTETHTDIQADITNDTQQVLVETSLIQRINNSKNLNNKSTAVAEMGDRLATIDKGQKVGRAAVSLSVGGSWVPIYHNVARAEAYLRTKWHCDPSNRFARQTGKKMVP